MLLMLHREARSSGIWDRWCAVQTTFCRGAARAQEIMTSPSFYLQASANEEAAMDWVKRAMGSFRVSYRWICLLH